MKLPKKESSSPFANWRWWVALPVAAVIIFAAAIFTFGKIVGYFSEWAFVALHEYGLRPLVVWTWGNKP